MWDDHGARRWPVRGTRAVGDPLLGVQDLGAYLDVPVKTIGTWRHRSTGPRGLRLGQNQRFRWTDVEEWLALLASGDED